MNVTYVGAGEDPSHFLRWLRYHPNATMAVDTETTGLDPWGDRLRLVQFGCKGIAYALPFPQQAEAIAEALRYCAATRPLVGHNTKFDAQFLANNGFDVSALVDDTRIVACLLGHNPERKGDSALKNLADHYLNANSSKAQQELKKIMAPQYEIVTGPRGGQQKKRIRDRWTWATIPVDTFEYWWYGGIDTILTADLFDLLSTKMVERGFADLYDLEMDVWLALQRAEQRGICVDLDYSAEQHAALLEQAAAVAAPYDEGFLSSSRKLAAFLESQGVKLPRTAPSDKFPDGQSSTSEAALLTVDHPIVDDILKYRNLHRQADTYFRAFLDLEVDGRIHTTINTIGARTGRMSSERPNLQNVPKREAGDFVRRTFMASPGRTLVMADFEQIEYRIFASMCGEPSMLEAFRNGEDMHAVTAELALGHKPSEKERDVGKGANFTELFGGGVEKFAETAGITEDAARRFKRKYHAAFPRVKSFTKAVMKYAQANLWSVETEFGRFIPVDAERPYAAVNYMVQGSAADVLKRAIRNIAGTEWDEFFVLPVHDELIFDVPNEYVAEFTKVLPDLMEDRETFAVPLTVDVTTAPRWGEKEVAA